MQLRSWAFALILLAAPALAQSLIRPGWFADPATDCKIWSAYPVFNEQVSWQGDCVGGFAEGKGVLRWILAGTPTAKKYDGDMKHGKMDGRGSLTFTNGDLYVGEFKDGERNGRGKATWFNRNTYEGTWKDGLPDGRGTYEWVGGNTYTGDWVKGKPNGRGVFKFLNGNSYEGEFRDGIINGRGRFRWANGNVYEGEFRNEVPHGEGSYKVHNTGEVHVGTWINGCLKKGDQMIGANQSELDCRLKR
jgi:hypothetical protein